MGSLIMVVNPNSSEALTMGIDAAITPLRSQDGPKIKCLTLAEGPSGIESDADVRSVIAPLCKLARSLEEKVAAFVNACFSDPGLTEMRAATRRPVFGIAESALLTALAYGQKVGILSILDESIERHARYIDNLGIKTRIAGDYSINLGIRELSNPCRTFARLTETGRRLRSERGADVLILGCAGMSMHRTPLEREVGCPVIDPCQAAVGMAINAVRLGLQLND